jgi:hypothetical protein
MGALSQALPREHQVADTGAKSESGVYKAQFLGLSDSYEYVSPWHNDKCRNCKGNGKNKNGDQACYLCGGSGKLTETRVKLIYKLENGQTEEEIVNFKMSPAGTSRDGQPLSPSKLFVRLRTLSGNRQASPQQLDEWYSNLTQPIRIPCSVVINGNKTGDRFVITDVLARTPNAPAAPAPAPSDEFASPDDDIDDSVPF